MRLIPKERKFFRMFRDVSENLTEGARLLHDILKNPDDLAQRINKLQEIEHRGDDMTHDIIRMLNQTFITPFVVERRSERMNILEIEGSDEGLIEHLDDVMSHIIASGLDLLTFVDLLRYI